MSQPDINVPATALNPEVKFNATTGLLVISGRSTMENPLSFYQPLFSWLDEYIKNPCKQTTLEFSIVYFNTSTSKYLYAMLNKMKQLLQNGNSITIKWHYEEGDEDIRDVGEDFSATIGIPFEFIEV